MPELPDVEGFRRYLARHAEGQRIVGVRVPDRQIVRNRSPQGFGQAVRGAWLASPIRHGKWLIAPLESGRGRADSDGEHSRGGEHSRDGEHSPDGEHRPGGNTELLLHFGMTGLLRWSESEADRHPHDRVIFLCERGELRYNNMRRFGGVWIARDRNERDQVTGPLGPDAATVDRDQFERLITARRGAIKAALMDQRLLAGVGNLLSDEILWRAGVHPKTLVQKLSTHRRGRLYEALYAAVHESIRYGRVPHGQRWLTRVRDERHPRCPRCGTALRRATVAGRTAVWCPREQR